MRKRWLTLAALAAVTVLIASLGAAVRGGSASAAHKAQFSACLVTDIGGLNDVRHAAYGSVAPPAEDGGDQGGTSRHLAAVGTGMVRSWLDLRTGAAQPADLRLRFRAPPLPSPAPQQRR